MFLLESFGNTSAGLAYDFKPADDRVLRHLILSEPIKVPAHYKLNSQTSSKQYIKQ